MTLTSQDGMTKVIGARVISVSVFYWPQLREGDPDVSYDVMAGTAGGDIVLGRYSTLARAEEIRDTAISNVEAGSNYAAPAS